MARVEQENASHTMQELPKREVVFSKRLTLRELLRIKPGEENETKDLPNDDPFGLEVEADHFIKHFLLEIPFLETREIKSGEEGETKGPINDVPFDFEVRDLGDSFLHIASFSENYPVSLRELFPLLQAAKPGGVSRRVSQDISGILDDWKIILPEVREKERRAKELYEHHKEYVPEFSEFEENHFDLFWKVLESGNKRREEVRFFNHQIGQFIDEREFFARYGKGVDFSKQEQIEDIALAYIQYFKPFLEEKGFNIPPNSDPDPFFLETRKLFDSMSEQEQKELVIEFYKKSVDKGGIEMERKFGRCLRWSEGYPGITTLTGENGELNRIDYTGALKPLDMFINEGDSSNEEPDSFRKLDNGQIELRKGESFIRISIIQGEDGYKKVKLEDHRLSTAETMVPLIVWQTDKETGEKTYHCGRLAELPKHDTLLGQLVVAAYSPKVRDQMPREITMRGINGQDITQEMLEAQGVLLVPRPKYRDQFLEQSPVILGLEALAKV